MVESIDTDLGAFVEQVLVVADHWHSQAVVAPARLHLDALFDQVNVRRAGTRLRRFGLRREDGLLLNLCGGLFRRIILLKFEQVDDGLKLVHDGFRRIFACNLGLLRHLVKVFPDLRECHLLLQ